MILQSFIKGSRQSISVVVTVWILWPNPWGQAWNRGRFWSWRSWSFGIRFQWIPIYEGRSPRGLESEKAKTSSVNNRWKEAGSRFDCWYFLLRLPKQESNSSEKYSVSSVIFLFLSWFTDLNLVWNFRNLIHLLDLRKYLFISSKKEHRITFASTAQTLRKSHFVTKISLIFLMHEHFLNKVNQLFRAM